VSATTGHDWPVNSGGRVPAVTVSSRTPVPFPGKSTPNAESARKVKQREWGLGVRRLPSSASRPALWPEMAEMGVAALPVIPQSRWHARDSPRDAHGSAGSPGAAARF
jgi:hypothetical protein